MAPLYKLIVTGLLIFIFCALTLVTWLSFMGAIGCVTALLSGTLDSIVAVNFIVSAFGMVVIALVSSGSAWFVFDFALNKILFPSAEDHQRMRGCVRSGSEDSARAHEQATRSILPPFLGSKLQKLFRMSAWQAGLAVSILLFAAGMFWLPWN